MFGLVWRVTEGGNSPVGEPGAPPEAGGLMGESVGASARAERRGRGRTP